MTGNHLTKIGRVFDSILFCLLLLGSFCDAQPQRTRRDQCLPGYFGPYCLSCECSNVTRECEPTKLEYESNCLSCECSDVTRECEPTKLEYDPISIPDSTLRLAKFHFDGTVSYVENEPLYMGDSLDFVPESNDNISATYWLAPSTFSGNRLSSYGGNLNYTISSCTWRLDISDAWLYSDAPSVVLISTHGLRIAYNVALRSFIGINIMRSVPLLESGWHHLRNSVNNISQDNSTHIERQVTRSEMLRVLANLKYLMIRYSYAKGQMQHSLIDVSFPIGKPFITSKKSLVERCNCPEGYSGLSCESCASGYEKIVNDPLNNIRYRCVRHDSI